ncbi:hypothetical protein WH47_12164 [Habropoda laboriosa]|uniref:Histone-lysine N-methyltransferase SETMAR n=1 Tax=Habropoda laboriosa TaxID=597456 RepID=A0A0L7RAF5_9HYME|nr:hypothetical protein WH47_12164 [Habropoda laboriosa]
MNYPYLSPSSIFRELFNPPLDRSSNKFVPRYVYTHHDVFLYFELLSRNEPIHEQLREAGAVKCPGPLNRYKVIFHHDNARSHMQWLCQKGEKKMWNEKVTTFFRSIGRYV